MSDERHETIDDIVKEMRGNAKHNHALVEVSKYLTEIADRIESAHRRFYDKYKEHTDELNRQILVLKREIETLRALVEGLIKASGDCASCGYDCSPRRENCITKQAIAYLEGHS